MMFFHDTQHFGKAYSMPTQQTVLLKCTRTPEMVPHTHTIWDQNDTLNPLGAGQRHVLMVTCQTVGDRHVDSEFVECQIRIGRWAKSKIQTFQTRRCELNSITRIQSGFQSESLFGLPGSWKGLFRSQKHSSPDFVGKGPVRARLIGRGPLSLFRVSRFFCKRKDDEVCQSKKIKGTC